MLGVPVFQTVVIKQLNALVDDERHDAGAQALLEHNEPPDAAVSVTAEEYENLIASALPDFAAVSTVNLDKDGDYKIDDYCAFEDDKDGLRAAVRSAL